MPGVPRSIDCLGFLLYLSSRLISLASEQNGTSALGRLCWVSLASVGRSISLSQGMVISCRSSSLRRSIFTSIASRMPCLHHRFALKLMFDPRRMCWEVCVGRLQPLLVAVFSTMEEGWHLKTFNNVTDGEHVCYSEKSLQAEKTTKTTKTCGSLMSGFSTPDGWYPHPPSIWAEELLKSPQDACQPHCFNGLFTGVFTTVWVAVWAVIAGGAGIGRWIAEVGACTLTISDSGVR